MSQKFAKILLALIIVAALIVSIIFWSLTFMDGEDMFVIGSIISSSVLMLLTNILFAVEFYDVACKKGHSESKYFWYSFIFGILGYLLVIALPDSNIFITNKE